MSDNEKQVGPDVESPRMIAVIDVGATAIRMEIAEIQSTNKSVRSIDKLQHVTNLGRNVFTNGEISQETIDQCVDILGNYKKTLDEYGIVDRKNIWAVGTSAVREAGNRDTFIDRVYMSTGIDINPLDIPETHRLTYNAIQQLLLNDKKLARRNAVVIEIGGGVTEILLFEGGKVGYSNSHSLGLQRLRLELELMHATPHKIDNILNQHLNQIEEGINTSNCKMPSRPALIAISGDARFAAECLGHQSDKRQVDVLDVEEVEQFAAKMCVRHALEVMREYNTTYEQAETVGPAMMIYVKLARLFKSKKIYVCHTSFRDGMLMEMAQDRTWTNEFQEQIIHSTKALGRKFALDEAHGGCVTVLALRLFDVMVEKGILDPRNKILLHVASWLHDIGHFISSQSHHKHAWYIIANSDLFGLRESDRLLIGLIARYHRRAFPKRTHEIYQTLSREKRLLIQKLASILRAVDALDRNHLQQSQNAQFEIVGKELLVTLFNQDPTIERIAMKQKGGMFEEVFGLRIRIQKGSASKNPV